MGRNSELMRIKYRDGRMLTIKEIADMHPELSPNIIRMRILKKGSDDIDALLEPPQVKKTYLDKIPLDGIGPRKEISELPEPTDYERQLWGY
jgi:hypothetical protein